MTIPAAINRRPGPLHEEIGQWAYDVVVGGEVFVIQWQTVREDITGDEILLNHVLKSTGWAVAGPIQSTGEATWNVHLVAAGWDPATG